MIRVVLLALAVLGLAGAAFADPVNDVVQRYMASARIPGVAVAIVEDGEVRRLETYGIATLETQAPVTADTAFQTASASKIFTGVLLMRLVEQGLIDLDAPIARYLPEAPDAWRAVTLRRLASHSSGMPEGLGLPPSATSAEMVAAAMGRPLAYPPGSESRYGFTDYIVLSAALERVSGLAFADLLEREIVKPLGLTNTGFDFASPDGPTRTSMIGERATTYAWNGDAQQIDGFLYPVNGYAAGGLYSSARDLATLFAAIETGRFIEPESFRLLTTAAPLADGRSGEFAIGWTARVYRGEPVYGHSGGPALADIMVVPRRNLALIVLTNERRFFPLLAEGIADTLWAAPAPRAGIADTDADLAIAVTRVLAGAGAGATPADAFADAGRPSREFLEGFGGALVSAVGLPSSIELLSDVRGDAGRRRVYRVDFETRDMIWVAVTDGAGRLIELRPGSETD